MTFLSHAAAGLCRSSMLMKFAVPSKRKLSEIECTLIADLAHLAKYCRLWHLNPSMSKTVTSVFHLHNNRSRREPNVHTNSQHLKHDLYQVYLGVTLERTLSYREHLSRSAAKLKSRNNLIAKLAGTSWGASASTLCTSALALCYSVAEYCCPVWTRSSHTNLIDTQLHSAMCLISGYLQPTQLSWLPVLSNVAPPSLCSKAASDNMLQIIEAHPNRPVYADVFEHSPPWLASRCPISLDMTSVDTITQLREDWSSDSVVNHTIVTDPTIWQPGLFRSHSSYMVSDEPFPCTNGVSPNHLPVIMASDKPWTTLSTCPLTKFKVDWIYSTKRMLTQSCGWNLQRLQHSRNNNK